MNALLGGSTGEVSADRGARQCIQRVTRLSRAIGIPRSLAELKIPQKAIPEMALAAMKVARPIENNTRPITEEDIVRLYNVMF
jgi:alcohol dehydrogenase class IV